jgi:hypothetical protein
MSPFGSDDLTTIIEQCGDEYIVFWSLEPAGHHADYRELGRFPTRVQAEDFLATG